MKQFALLSSICFLFACNSQKDKNNFANLIKGDWVGKMQNQDKKYPNDNETIFGCFEDSTYQNSLNKDTVNMRSKKIHCI